ncbi:MAG: hypothetical protein M1817_001415 [Caeruleum heppii]|nr:MAG: hypothetical protein M1817_001415 [Caeruleum heppii]
MPLFFFPWSLASFLLLIYVCIGIDPVVAAYNPNQPHTIENFDPAEANPAGKITCLGPLPPWPLPSISDYDANTFTLQELCAKPQYGGRAPYQHLGGFCFTRREASAPIGSRQFVAFDFSDGAKISDLLWNPRSVLYCRSRCYCDAHALDRSVQPYIVPDIFRTAWKEAFRGYAVKIDVPDDYSMFAPPHRNEHEGFIKTTSVWRATEVQPAPNVRNYAFSEPIVTMDQANHVTCEGPLPRWSLPWPFTPAQFSSLQRLCAVQLSGGNLDVFFTDEMTPRVDWTWANFAVSAALRFHCYRHCRCSNLPERQNRTRALVGMWRFLEGADLVERADGAVEVQVRDRDRSPSKIPILPAMPADGSPAPAGTCGPDRVRLCSSPWPSDVLGPIPTGPPPLEALEAVDGQTSRLPQCGAKCVSNEACRAPGSPLGCRCVVPSETEARTIGADPVFPMALCLLITQGLVQGPKKVNPLGGRAVPNEETAWACACNRTYVSRSCCQSDGGMVWEDHHLRLGQLASIDR